jgi:hypothetical protein
MNAQPQQGLHLNLANLSLANLKACETIAVGAASTLLRAYGHEPRAFWTKHPELWRPEIPAAPFRHFLACGE